MKTVKLDRLNRLILFGGGALLVECAKIAKKQKLDVYVFAVKRHLEEIIDKYNFETMEQVLTRKRLQFFKVKDINKSKELKSLVTNDTVGIGLGEAYTFDKQTIKLFNNKLLDFMTINLPEYRGGAHFTWQILRRSKIGCWNIQLINEEMIPGVFDSGKILKTRLYKIPINARTPEGYFRLANSEGLKLFKEFLNETQKGKKYVLKPLDENKSSYFPRLYTLKHGFINWQWNAAEIESFICAFDKPYAGASTFINCKKVFLQDCKIDFEDGKFHPFISGIVYKIYKNIIYVAANGGTLILREVLNEKRENINNELKTGQRFYTPNKYLEDAMMFNAEYNSEGLVKYK